MSLEGWLLYGDRGPIIGKWPVERIRAYRAFQGGEFIVIDNGMIREKHFGEWGAKIPEGGYIGPSDEGAVLRVPDWWWRVHFAERLGSPYPAEHCCWPGELEGEQCGDCPR